jgi:hypothetical protein
MYVPSDSQIADIMTKPLTKPKFEKLCFEIGLVCRH